MERTVTVLEKDSITNHLRFHPARLENLIRENFAENLPVILISIAGPHCTGKSFLLNFMVKLLNGTNSDDWIEAESESVSLNLDAMTVESGDSPNVGCCMKVYHKIFRLKNENNEEVGVMLIDCKGFHGRDLTFSDAAKIFTLSSFVSGLQIYNFLEKRIRAEDLHFLDLVCTCSKLVSDARPFSDLGFLIRDYNNASDLNFNGDVEGRFYLESWLRRSHNTDFGSLKNRLNSCYSSVNCFPFPSPGNLISSRRTNDAFTAQVDQRFKENVQSYVANICRNLKAKQVDGHSINCSQLLQRFQDKFDEINSQNVFNLKLLKHSVSRDYYEEKALKLYKLFCDQIGTSLYNEHSDYEACRQDKLQQFDNLKDLGCSEIRDSCRQKAR